MRFSWLLALAFTAIVLIPPAGAQIPTFSVKTSEVRIDVLVTDHGKPVTGLQAADFEVLDNGVRQNVEFVSLEQMPVSATLVLDMSASVAGMVLNNLKSAGNLLLGGLRKDERAALITFSYDVSLISPPTSELNLVRAALDAAQSRPTGYTSVIDATYAGLILAESKSDRPLIILFSDGHDTGSWLTSGEVLESAKQTDAVVYAVSAGRDPYIASPGNLSNYAGGSQIHIPDNEFLRDLCKYTGGSLFEVESTKNLGNVFLSILEEFRHRYLLTYIPQGVTKSGWHSLKVRVKRHNDRVMHRPGYMPDSPAKEGE